MFLYKVVILISLKLSLVSIALGDDCVRALRRSSGTSDPPFRKSNFAAPLPSSDAVQAIITTYQFHCTCNITSWETYVEPAGRMNALNMPYNITFQVWRPSPTVQSNGCYSLVGQNEFPSFSFSNGGVAQLTPTPPSNSIITAQSGDVVGYYTNSRQGSDNGIQLERDQDYNQNMIWYLSLADGSLTSSGDSSCPYPIGTERYLSSSIAAAPMLRINSDVAECLLPTTSSPILSSAANTFFQTTTANPNDISPRGTGSNTVIAVVMVILLLLIAASVAAVLIFFVMLKRKASFKKSHDLSNPTDLSNPVYETPVDNVVEREQSTRFESDKYEEATYACLADEEGSDYLLPELTHNSNPEMQHPDSRKYFTGAEKDNIKELYYEEGPDADSRYRDVSSNPLPLPGRNFGFVKKVDDSSYRRHYDIANEVYEEPLPLAPQESIKIKPVFNRVGNYVLSAEQRSKSLKEASHQTNSATLKFFKEDDIYWTPASTTSELYAQLATKQYRELSRDQIQLENKIGCGQFGEVCKAIWSIGQEKMDLAIKTLKPGASEEDEVKFLQEAAIMGQFNHRNIVKMYGVVTLGKPVLICLEILDHGDLREYLLKMNPQGSKFGDFMETELVFLKFAKEVAAGMEYLSQKSFVHRDLAARNILLSKYLTCKIADFGMARDLMDDDYYTSSGGKIPVKWTAPEALLYKKYSTDSDVWSYGMILYEIWSVGRKPFSTKTNQQVLQLIQTGYCQAPPPGCPRTIFELMVDCWHPEHQQRPSFHTIYMKLVNESPEKLLYWSSSDDSLSSAVGVCGAELSEAEKLYPNLQRKYINLDRTNYF